MINTVKSSINAKNMGALFTGYIATVAGLSYRASMHSLKSESFLRAKASKSGYR